MKFILPQHIEKATVKHESGAVGLALTNEPEL